MCRVDKTWRSVCSRWAVKKPTKRQRLLKLRDKVKKIRSSVLSKKIKALNRYKFLPFEKKNLNILTGNREQI